jgi:hypothetical protein
MVRECRVRELPEQAFHYGSASASNGRWVARRVDDWTVEVWHYRTLMVRFLFENVDRGVVYAQPVSRGWGSQTDKVGIGGMLQQVRASNARSYRELYQEV